ncbi:MAG: PTS fructose transporter subunit IIA [Gammaproteobacteria bacterium]|nr:PTS fructose transporter subunit IIA [Gammaproteobacteria bacterium]
MSIGLLIITHDSIGDAFLTTAKRMFEKPPLACRTLEVNNSSNPDEVNRQALELVKQLDKGDGVLVLTDMYGSTPSNIAARLLHKGKVNVVAGINLPMLVRVLNYAELNLDELTLKAVSGGNDGIVRCIPGTV